MDRIKNFLKVFLAFFKIGLITFGGGYAMIAVMERELVEKKGWITHEEFLDMIAVAESSPGPIAVNSATFIGYKKGGFFGSLFATLGVVLPSFIIIFAISLFFDKFLSLEFVGYAFRGIQVAVAFLILSAGVKMLRSLKKTVFNGVMVTLTIAAMVVTELFAPDFSTVFMILIGGGIGVFIYLITAATKKAKKNSGELKDEKAKTEEKESEK